MLADQFNLVVFSEAVVKSSVIEKALKRISGSGSESREAIVFVASNFTQECFAMGKNPRYVFASERDFVWTDTRYEYIKVVSSCAVKGPDVRERSKAGNSAEQVVPPKSDRAGG